MYNYYMDTLNGKIVYQGTSRKGRSFIIRYPKADDALAMQNYINSLSREQTFIRMQGEQMTLEEEQQYLTRQLEKINNHQAVNLLVFSDQQLIGIAGIDMRDKVERHIGGFGISIAQEFRGEGLGTVLMEVILKEAQQQLPQLKIVHLQVYSNNPLAINLYKEFGFTEYGRLPKGIQYRDQFVDSIWMYKDIGETK